MRGFGAKCPYCRCWMLTRGHWKTSDTHRTAVAQCLKCRQRVRLHITVSPLRPYRKRSLANSKAASTVTGHKPRRRGLPVGSASDELASDAFGLGERCPNCQSGMYIRSSRHVAENHRVFYLDCPTPDCGKRERADIRGTLLPPLQYWFQPVPPIPFRLLLLLK